MSPVPSSLWRSQLTNTRHLLRQGLALLPRITWNSWSSCFILLSGRITCLHHYAWLCFIFVSITKPSYYLIHKYSQMQLCSTNSTNSLKLANQLLVGYTPAFEERNLGTTHLFRCIFYIIFSKVLLSGGKKVRNELTPRPRTASCHILGNCSIFIPGEINW